MLSEQTIVVIEEMLQEEYDEVIGTLMLYEFQLTLPLRHRKVPEDQLDETLIKNLRLRAIHLGTALQEFNHKYHGRQQDIQPHP